MSKYPSRSNFAQRPCDHCGNLFQPDSNRHPFCCIGCALFSRVKISTPDECWEWTGAKTGGYGQFRFNKLHYRAHAVAWEVKNGKNMPKGTLACHKCDNPLCCNPSHIFPGTIQDNMDDRNSKNRHAYGARMGSTNLTDDQVREILSFPATITHKHIADKYGVAPSTISAIRKRQRWVHIEANPCLTVSILERGDRVKGESHHRAKLTLEKVEEIKQRYKSGESQGKLSKEYGIAQTTVSRIILGKIWAHV